MGSSSQRPAKRVRLDPSAVLPADIHSVVQKHFHRLRDLSFGSSSVVFKARDLRTNEIVALKRLTHHDRRRGAAVADEEERRWRAEVECLASCRHPNVVRFKELARDASGGHVFLVMEYGCADLGKLLAERSRPFLEGEVKFLMSQLLQGVKCIHARRIVHGDLKPTHVLIDNQGEVKICGFGRSRRWGSNIAGAGATTLCCYMAPEVVLGSSTRTRSAASADMWSVGCIMAELLSKKALFHHEGKGKSQTQRRRNQIKKIFQILGTPDRNMWPGVSRLPEAVQVIRSSTSAWSNILRRMFPEEPKPLFPSCPTLSPEGYDLLAGLLNYDPRKRLTVEAALDHPWFRHQSSSGGGSSSSSPPAVKPKDIIFRSST